MTGKIRVGTPFEIVEGPNPRVVIGGCTVFGQSAVDAALAVWRQGLGLPDMMRAAQAAARGGVGPGTRMVRQADGTFRAAGPGEEPEAVAVERVGGRWRRCCCLWTGR